MKLDLRTEAAFVDKVYFLQLTHQYWYLHEAISALLVKDQVPSILYFESVVTFE